MKALDDIPGEHGIALAQDGGVLVVALDNQPRLNALSSVMLHRLAAIFERVRDDTAVRAIVITGKGKAFCAGADVGDLPHGTGFDRHDAIRPMTKFTPRHAKVFKPVICAVNGICASAGLHFVADSDIVIASEQAQFLDTHMDVGQVCAIEPIGLSRRAPLGPTLRMVILGRAERLDARGALAAHLISEIVPQDQLFERAMALAHQASQASPAALQASLEAIWESFELSLEDAYAQGWARLVRHRAHPDATEGPRAFMEKRPPVWS
ncbi:enoyl-CoA hydratase/isomerase family protein [Sphingomonas flavalba]|uniref:enoyl-CoA hydratase/isomerase family protein n=1 Tax=Sphingomonas flavalba TaxID=2559804 RepID=UPI0039E12E8D